MVEREILQINSTDYEAKFVGRFTLREVLLYVAGAAVALPVGFALNKYFVTEFSVIIAGCVAAPFVLCTRKFGGVNFERFAQIVFRTSILSPSKRRYKSAINLRRVSEKLTKSQERKAKRQYKKELAEYESYE